MFYECSSLKDLNLANFTNNKINDMEEMFSGCLSLINLNLPKFNIDNVTNKILMFKQCPNELKKKFNVI